MTDRELEFLALTEEYDEILNLPWTGKRLYGCYEIIRKYYMFRHGYELIDFNARKVTRFTDDAVNEQGASYVYRSNWGDTELDISQLQQDDVLVFRLYTDPMGGGYSTNAKHNIPNHGGVYLGNGWMLHHPYGGVSELVDLFDPNYSVYQMSCVGALRRNVTDPT